MDRIGFPLGADFRRIVRILVDRATRITKLLTCQVYCLPPPEPTERLRGLGQCSKDATCLLGFLLDSPTACFQNVSIISYLFREDSLMKASLKLTLAVLSCTLVIGSDIVHAADAATSKGSVHARGSEATGRSSQLPVPKCLRFATHVGCATRSMRLFCRSSKPKGCDLRRRQTASRCSGG